MQSTYNIHTAVSCDSNDGIQRPEIHPNDAHLSGVAGLVKINCWVCVVGVLSEGKMVG